MCCCNCMYEGVVGLGVCRRSKCSVVEQAARGSPSFRPIMSPYSHHYLGISPNTTLNLPRDCVSVFIWLLHTRQNCTCSPDRRAEELARGLDRPQERRAPLLTSALPLGLVSFWLPAVLDSVTKSQGPWIWSDLTCVCVTYSRIPFVCASRVSEWLST
jgi:hypothetical protein